MKNKRKENEECCGASMSKLTEEDLNVFTYYKELSAEQKSELLTFIYEISFVLYNSHFDNHGGN